MSDEINYPPGSGYTRTTSDWLVPAWFWVLAVLWSIGAVGGIWYLVERMIDAA